jgi:hypothetical protein
MDIAKVTNVEEYLQVVEAYKELLKDPKTTKSVTLKEMRNKLESFINKHLISVNKKAIKNPAKLPDLLSFLMLID